MLHKKYTVKENLALGKAEVKKIRGEFMTRLGDDLAEFGDSVWDKKATAQRRRWQINTYSSATIFIVNGVPLLLAVEGFPEDAGDLLKEADVSALLPTIFLLLKAQLTFQSDSAKFDTVLAKFGSTVVCRGPTSRFLLSGAHLMMPGICGVTQRGDAEAGDAALITSLGRPCPYAVGYCTSQIAANAESGIGVYVVHSYADSLWSEFRDVFISTCAPGVECIPSYLSGKEVPEDLAAFQAAHQTSETPANHDTESEKEENGEAVDGETVAAAVAGEEVNAKDTNPADGGVEEGDADQDVATEDANADHTQAPVEIDVEALFSDVDTVLNFALCQTVLSISPSRLPLPVAQFTSALVLNYPRGLPDQRTIDFKDTPYKKALTYLTKCAETVTVSEVRKGVHEITALNRASPMMREHKKKYTAYIAHVYSPALLVEAKEAEQRLLQDSKTVFHQQLLSVSSLYKPRKGIAHEVLLVLLCGNVTAGVAKPSFPSLEDLEQGRTAAQKEETRVELDDGAMDELYPRKSLIDNLKAYIKHHSLMIPGGKGELPAVKIEGVLCEFISRGALKADTLPLDQVEAQCLRQFTEVCEIVMQTSISGSSITSSSIPPMRLVKNGTPPRVNMWTEKRAGNKTITIVRNLEALCFNLTMLCAAWRQKFSTSCTVFDPASDMKNLKSGTKVPLELHIQGDKTKDLTALFAKDLGVPPLLLVAHR